MNARYLVDKSALARMPLEPVRSRLGPIIESGEAATCAIIDLEVLFSARDYREHEEIRRRRSLAYHNVALTEQIFQRAVSVQGRLAQSGRHRVSIPDLIIVAAAEAKGLTILHYDGDFDLIAEVTGQPAEWIVPRGTV